MALFTVSAHSSAHVPWLMKGRKPCPLPCLLWFGLVRLRVGVQEFSLVALESEQRLAILARSYTGEISALKKVCFYSRMGRHRIRNVTQDNSPRMAEPLETLSERPKVARGLSTAMEVPSIASLVTCP